LYCERTPVFDGNKIGKEKFFAPCVRVRRKKLAFHLDGYPVCRAYLHTIPGGFVLLYVNALCRELFNRILDFLLKTALPGKARGAE
jgi:hypothetical protein